MPRDANMVFVIVLHLSPKQESRVDEVIQRGRERAPVPPEFRCHADKENASALTFTVAMQTTARAFVDRWLEPQSDESTDKCLSDDVSHPVEKTRLRSRRSCQNARHRNKRDEVVHEPPGDRALPLKK
jgi:hypothetical protein